MKTIGIKLADGSFYPVLQEGNASEKKLDLTTAHNNQTKVMVDLYRSANCTMDDAEYVDSLQIENLIAHPNGEPDISFSVSLDENNELSAKIVDTETGKQSNTTITLVSRTQEERLITDEYDISDSKEDKSTGKVAAGAAVAGVGLLAAAAALRAKEEKDSETEVEFKPAANDEIKGEEDTPAEDTPAAADETPVVEDIPADVAEETPAAMEDTFASEDVPSDATEDTPAMEDFSTDGLDDTFAAEETPAADETIVEEDIPSDAAEETPAMEDFSTDGLDDTFTTEETPADVADETIVEEDIPSEPADDALDQMPDLDFELPEENKEETPALNEEDFVMEDTPTEDTIVEEETPAAVEDTFAGEGVPSDAAEDTPAAADETPAMEDFSTDGLDDTFASDDISATDDINFDFPGDDSAEYLANDKVSSDETISDDTDDLDLPDFSDIPTDTEISSDKNEDFFNMDDDFLDKTPANDDVPAGNGISFTGLYDKDDLNGTSSSFSDDEEDEKKKTKVPVTICIICAIICIIATVLILFIIPSKYNLFSKKDSQEKAPVEKIIEAEPSPAPVVTSEPEPEPVPPAKEEEIVIIEKAEEVVPEQPKVTEKKPENISYKIKWGDTLWDIADTYYKNPWRYKYIARWNGIKDPDVIISGTYIIIPAE